jgi:hypothetical protein
MTLCKYKDIFGKPKQEIHSYRIFNIAIVDVILTFIVAYLIHVKIYPKINYSYLVVSLFIVGIISHRLFCVKTTIDNILFNSY